ncbi:hypothetical protein C8J57DRAFT_1544694 [Mycena rebaudengoi]|nr:hypothetical protein C8J57DRAFT_1544694 [Mycena rebaudengoi]
MPAFLELGGVILPPELERVVFETAALLYHTQIPTLMLVARRIHRWLQPLLYRVLVSSKRIPSWNRLPSIGDPLLTEQAALLQKHARHFFLHSPFMVAEIFAVCTAVRDLACYCQIDPSFIPYLDRIRPQRLYVATEDLLAGPPDLSHSLFSSITHLELTDYKDFINGIYNSVSAYPIHDVRFVVAAYDDDFVGDWIRGAWGQADVWVRADNFIRLKRRGKVPRDGYFIAKDEFANVE